MKNYFDLTGEVAVVTGGAGLLGSRYVEALKEAGAKVASFDIRLPKETIGVLELEVDITKKTQVKNAFAIVGKNLGIPTILINNAGIDSHPNALTTDNGSFEDYQEKTWDLVLNSHLKGAFFVSQEFLKRFRASKKSNGSIINVSSTYGLISPDQSLYEFRRKNGEKFFKPVTYSVAKSGMLNFTRWLAEYCVSSGLPVRVNTLVPGGVFNGQSDEFVKDYSKRTILGRMARTDEYNAAILFLASHKASSYMTGSTLVVDGGWTAK